MTTRQGLIECEGERKRLFVRWSAKAAVILANGYALFFFSERVFWSFPRPNNSLVLRPD